MLFTIVLACGDPVQEYTIPTGENSKWEKWEEKGQKGPPIGEAKGPPSPDEEDLPPPVDDGELPPPTTPVGELPEVVEDMQTGTATCKPIASSEPLAPQDGGVKIIGEIQRNEEQNGPLLIEFVRVTEKSFTLYGVACGSGSSFSVGFPKNLGEGYVMVFIDTDGNGPSEKDVAAISEKITIIDKDISIGKLQFGGSISPVTMPLTMQVPDIEMDPVPSGDLPTNTDELPPPQTGEGKVPFEDGTEEDSVQSEDEPAP
jgi:hypothetical protein